MMQITVKPEAEQDLRDIGRYIARDNPGGAISYIRVLRQQIAKIADHPRSYPVRDDLGDGLRKAVYGKYLILFVITDNDVIEILRVLHGARDLGEVFS